MKIFKPLLAALLLGAMAAPAAEAGISPVRKHFDTARRYKAQATAKQNAPEEEFKSIGKGLYRDNFLQVEFVTNVYPEVEVEIMESTTTPGRYRIMNPYKDYPPITIYGGEGVMKDRDYYITVDASDPEHVYIERSNTGFMVSSTQTLMVWSIADDYYNNRHGNWILADKEGVCGKLVDGEITFPKLQILACFRKIDGSMDNEEWDWLMANTAGKFRILLPGFPDVESEIKEIGINDDKTKLTYNLTLGESIESARVALVKNYYSADAVKGIIDGSIPSIEVTGSGDVEVDYTGDGAHTLYMVPFVGGRAYRTTYLEHELAYDESEWRKCGEAMFHENIIGSTEYTGSYFEWQEDDIIVKVEESVSSPGKIRLVDPYGPGYRYYSSDDWDGTRKHYLVIDGSESDAVFIEKLEDIGSQFNTKGVQIWSKAARSLENGASKEAIHLEGTFGKYENNRITFPKDALLVMFNANPMGWYWGNHNGKFSIEFAPGQIQGGVASVSNIEIENASEARYFTLDGMEISTLDGTAPGIYIVKKEGKTFKQIVK